MDKSHKKLLVLGSLGETSQFIKDIFYSIGDYDMYGIDCVPAQIPHDHELQFDLLNDPLSRLSKLIQSSAVIAVCLPVAVFVQILPEFIQYMRDGTLLIDTFAIKSNYLSLVNEAMNKHKKSLGVLSLHPLFKPELGIKHYNIIASQMPADFNCDEIYHALETLGGHVIKTQENDKLMRFIQVIPHGLILIYGLMLKNSGVSFGDIMRVSTPPVRHLLYLLARILSGNPKVYWEIQHENPDNAQSYATILQEIEQFSDVILNHNQADFVKMFHEMSAYVGAGQVTSLSNTCADIFQQYKGSLNE